MLRRTQLGLTLLAFALPLAAYGCSSSSDAADPGGGGGSTGGTSGKCGDTGVTCTLPPGPAPSGPAADGTDDTVLAVSALYLGDTDRQGNADPAAWKAFGFNLDGLVTGPKSTDVCKVVTGANPAQVKTDGTGGIDNSFGENIMPIIVGLASDASAKINESLQKGSFTIMVKADKLGSGKTYFPVNAALYGGADLGAAPKWDGTDKWPLLPELVNNNDPTKPKVTFPQSYLLDNTWVSGTSGDVNLSIDISGYSLTLTIHKATLAAKLADDHKSADNGTIAGVLKTEELNGALKKVAGKISSSLCAGSTLDSILQQIAQASDIMSDGTQSTDTCDAISIGLGFDMKAVQLGDVAPAGTPGADPCADGGA